MQVLYKSTRVVLSKIRSGMLQGKMQPNIARFIAFTHNLTEQEARQAGTRMRYLNSIEMRPLSSIENVEMSTNIKSTFVKCFFGAALFCASTLVKADQFYVTVGMRCDQVKSELTIYFNGAWDEKGEAMISAHQNNAWNTWDLVSITTDNVGKYLIKKKLHSRLCVLNGNQYRINVMPMMAPNFHPEGNCATRMGAMATVFLKNKKLTTRGLDACTETGFITESIIIRPNHSILYKDVPAEQFYAEK